VGPNSVDRGKSGSKRHLLVDRNGVPLAVWLTAANVNDSEVFEDLIEAVEPIRRPGGQGRPRSRPAKLYGDKAYDSRRCRAYLRRLGSLAESRARVSSRASDSGDTAGSWSGRSPG
jgi:IS5 family transposase